MSNDLVVVTPDFLNPPGPSDILVESCRNQGIELRKFGTNKPWVSGSSAKFIDLPEFIKTLDAKYVMMLDSNDTFISPFTSEGDIINTYCNRLHDPDILLSVEKNCFPFKLVKRFFDDLAPKDRPWRYLNGGAWMGKKDKVLHMLEEARDKCFFSCDYPQMQWMCDQSMLTHWYLTYGVDNPNILLDYDCAIFQNMFLSNDDISCTGYNSVTRTYPKVFHYNGDKRNYKFMYETFDALESR